jgi:DNA-binding NarL/FixJ family response regulator
MSLFERLLVWLGVIPPPNLHQYRQEENLRGLTLQSVRQEQYSDEDAYEDSFTAKRSKYATSDELWNCWQSLSPREQEVTALTCLGYTNSEIASKLGVSATTIKSHIRSILSKFQMHSKIELGLALEDWNFRDWDRPPYR